MRNRRLGATKRKYKDYKERGRKREKEFYRMRGIRLIL
jgi:hypothetical protein